MLGAISDAAVAELSVTLPSDLFRSDRFAPATQFSQLLQIAASPAQGSEAQKAFLVPFATGPHSWK
jgi:hypothetical protein